MKITMIATLLLVMVVSGNSSGVVVHKRMRTMQSFEFRVSSSGFPAKQSQPTTQSDTEATRRKAEALIAYLEKKKDKRVEKVVLNKYSWAGIPSEELVNYNIKIGDVKYTVVRQGKDKKDENYLSFDVKTAKVANITIDDEGVDGSIDRGMDVMTATKEEKKIYGTKAYQLKERERWQGEYEKTIDALMQFLGITVPQS